MVKTQQHQLLAVKRQTNAAATTLWSRGRSPLQWMQAYHTVNDHRHV